jgi:hypothetical protein
VQVEFIAVAVGRAEEVVLLLESFAGFADNMLEDDKLVMVDEDRSVAVADELSVEMLEDVDEMDDNTELDMLDEREAGVALLDAESDAVSLEDVEEGDADIELDWLDTCEDDVVLAEDKEEAELLEDVEVEFRLDWLVDELNAELLENVEEVDVEFRLV